MAVSAISLEVTGEMLPGLRQELGEWLARAGATEVVRDEILLACWEATANAIEHPVEPKGHVLVAAERREDHILVAVTDSGTWRSRSEDRHDRGLGLKLIAALMDRVQVVTTAHGTRLLMYRCLASRCS
jgi:serine/threonine-protein kinase RsbW